MQQDQTDQNPTPNLPTDRRALLAGIGGLAAGAFIAGKANAGPLSPPAGPIAPTPGPEPRIAINAVNTPGDANSLYKITQPGSYYLTGNITGVAGKHGVEIAASGVTLDLNGFDLVGVANAGGQFSGVYGILTGMTNVALTNGSVRDWQGSGVELQQVTGCLVKGVRASGNGQYGILSGESSIISDCSASGNRGGTSYGIFVSTSSVVTNCTVKDNDGGGILANNYSMVNNCTASENSGRGIYAPVGSAVIACSASSNQDNGIELTVGGVVENCVARLNDRNGIQVSSGALVRDNNCSQNGDQGSDGANIYATGSDNRIEGNNCTGADRGIDVDGSGNFIVRNTCSGNTINWAISANNVFGPIVDRRSPNTSAFFGDSAASSLGTTDANANFTY
jgi:parallel beta-helix repeat protein